MFEPCWKQLQCYCSRFVADLVSYKNSFADLGGTCLVIHASNSRTLDLAFAFRMPDWRNARCAVTADGCRLFLVPRGFVSEHLGHGHFISILSGRNFPKYVCCLFAYCFMMDGKRTTMNWFYYFI